jgi:hypothetical protein
MEFHCISMSARWQTHSAIFIYKHHHCKSLYSSVRRWVKYECGALAEWYLQSKNRSTQRKTWSQCHFVHYKSHKNRNGIEPGRVISDIRWVSFASNTLSCSVCKCMSEEVSVSFSVSKDRWHDKQYSNIFIFSIPLWYLW